MAFDRDTVETLELAASIVGPILEEKRLNDRWLIVKAFDSLATQGKRLFGPGFRVRKLVTAALLAAAAFLSLAQGAYEIDADAEIEGLVRRAVVAPYDGFIKEASARPGDAVKEGQTVAALEDRDLLLERLKWVTERQQRLYEYDKALAGKQPAIGNVAKAQIDQADAQIKLIDAQLARIKLRAPIDGQIVSGDLSQLIGTAVQRGQVLFEIAPLDVYRVTLDVDERDIGTIAAGQNGQLVVTALPQLRLPFTVTRLTPIAEVRGGRNAFRVEGRLSDNPPDLGRACRASPRSRSAGKQPCLDLGASADRRRAPVWRWRRWSADEPLAVLQFLVSRRRAQAAAAHAHAHPPPGLSRTGLARAAGPAIRPLSQPVGAVEPDGLPDGRAAHHAGDLGGGGPARARRPRDAGRDDPVARAVALAPTCCKASSRPISRRWRSASRQPAGAGA